MRTKLKILMCALFVLGLAVSQVHAQGHRILYARGDAQNGCSIRTQPDGGDGGSACM